MKRAKSWLRSELVPWLLIVGGVFAFRSSLADHYYVPSGSMENTLFAGDRVLVSKLTYGLRLPFTAVELSRGKQVARGDVVIFDSPRDGARLIKRIIGVGGDVVSLHDGHLVVNGVAAGEHPVGSERIGSHVALLNLADGGGPDIDRLEIPEGMLLAVGDHRGNSLDGRYFGLVREEDVYGKALAVYYRRDGEGFTWKGL